ncbi:Uncharacterized conserved protein YgbK, DUF1537 family [Microlunatus flavus]|uniref:Uncharacterized conserved protein YgbK, DUF1537 family n=1 Tax=Microlunatus flavus TaxID=1036181 RepID=A0A1H8ZVH1_9ACTN|nr:Uncharacterized conserved protein YgbK, DUF1537 family [Microlunatus flavus]
MLGLVADDLTGAGDSAVGFAAAGWTAVLALRATRLRLPAATGPVVLAVSTGARAAPDDEAAARTAAAVDALVAAGAERLYVKIDSTVRGSVAGQVDGALSAWSRHQPGAHALVCPAFPAQRRTVVDGEVLVAGRPLAESAAALDPVTPRLDGDLGRVVPGAVRRPVGDLGAAAPGTRLVVDARDEDELDRIARTADAAGADLVLVGSGGLAAALGRVWSSPLARPTTPPFAGRVLVAVSSLHPAALDQVGWLRNLAAAGVDVLTTPPEVVSPQAAARDLAGRVGDALATRAYDALVLVGGDGAAAVLDRLEADGVDVDGAVVPGCPTGTVTGGPAHGLRLVTKSGGFGDTSALDAIVRGLRDPAAPPAPAGSDRPHPLRHPDAAPRPTPKEAR